MRNFKGKRVLVAGGAGLIGTPLHKMLIEAKDAEVTVVSLDNRMRVHPKARFLQLDMIDLKNCKKACFGMDYVFNLLCLKGSPRAIREKPATFFDANIYLDLNLLRAAQWCGVKGFLLASSLAVYPPAEVFFEDDAANEKLPSKNDRFAGFAKLAGEVQAQAYMVEHELTVSIVRPATTYGPYDAVDSEKSMVVPSFIKRAVSGENPFRGRGDGSVVRDVIFSEDVARGMIHVAKCEETRPINLGSGIGYTTKELAEAVVGALENPSEIVWDGTQSVGDKKRVLDTSRAKSIGFSPQVTLEDGVRRTIEWYRANKKQLDTT